MDTSKRVRASKPRTRTGCANCRQRRIKCDEGRPSCQRCVRSGWTCPGYNDTASSTDRQQASTANLDLARASSPSGSITQYSVPFKVPGSQEERRALHYFANFAAADLCGYLPSNLWSRTILQRCQHDVPVRHAASALGRAHMEYITAPDTTDFNVSEDTTEAYRKAVKALRNYLGRNTEPNKAMVLMCSAIFFCFELVRADRRAALQHLRSGVEILKGWQSDEATYVGRSTDGREELLAAFVRMDLQASMFDEGRVPALRVGAGLGAPLVLIEEDEAVPFESLCEAQECLLCLMHESSVYLAESTSHKFSEPQLVPNDVKLRRRQLVAWCDQWNERLTLFHEKRGTGQVPGPAEDFSSHATTRSGSTVERRIISSLKIHWQTIRLLLLHSLEDATKESAPSFDNVADEQLQLARWIIHAPENTASAEQQRTERSFSLHLGVVIPLLLLALKTKKQSVRHASIEMLQAAKGRREGFYDAEKAASLVAGMEALDVNAVRDSDGSDFNALQYEKMKPDNSRWQALEWIVDPAMGVRCWEDDAERLDGWERLWTAVA